MKKLFVLIAAACMTCTAAFAQTVKPFKEGERAVFLGNSITDGGHYHSYIWLYYMTRFPDMPIRVFNGGIGGDTAYDMNKRLDVDIFAMGDDWKGKFDFLKEEFPNLKIMYFPRGKVSSSNIKKEIGKLYSKKESSDNTTK